MREIQAEETTYVYFTHADGPGETVMGLQVRGLSPAMEWHLTAGSDTRDIRLVLIKSVLWPGAGQVYYLHWDDRRDLDALDQKVEEGAYTDEDFEHAAKTEYSRTVCPNCGLKWDTLVMPPGDPYLGAPGLYEVKFRNHRVKRCPNCGADLRQAVVKIFDSVYLAEVATSS